MSRNLTTLQPSTTYPYLVQTDVETTTAGILTASLQTGLGVSIAHLDVAVATASYALNANTDAFTSSLNALNNFTASYYVDSASFSASIADLYQLTSSYLTTASFNFATASFVKSVNAVLPDSVGNVAVSIAATGTGTLANRPLSASNAFLYVVSQDPNPADNGDAYIFVTSSLVPGSGSWEVIAPLDQAASDARYLMLAGTNAPMQGNVDWGGYLVSNLALPVTGSDVANKTYVDDTLTAFVTNPASQFAGTSSFALTTLTALTASYIPNLQEITTAGNVTTASVIIGTGTLTGGATLGYAFLAGLNNKAGKATAIALGGNNSVGGPNFLSIGIGNNNSSSGDYSVGIGTNNQSIASNAISLGNSLRAVDTNQIVLGNFNLPVSGTRAFIVGNGTGVLSRSNLIYAFGNQVQITGSLLVSGGTISGSFAGSITNAVTASYVSGAILNTPDPYTSTAPVFRIVTLTSAEYAAIATPDANTFYAIV